MSSFAHRSTDLTLSWFGLVLVPLKRRWCENVATGFSSAEWLPRGLHQLGVKPELASVLLILLFVMFFFLNMSKLISLKEA